MTQTSIALALAGLSFMLAVIWGDPLIRILRHYNIGDVIRVEGPEQLYTKLGTPTMGGVMFLVPVVFITLLLNAVNLVGLNVTGRSVLFPLFVMVGYGILGAIDDLVKVRARLTEGEGIKARYKFIGQIVLAGIIGYVLHDVIDAPELFIPGVRGEVQLGFLYIPLVIFIVVGTSNAINFTDGLDGLAGVLSATAFASFGGIALLQGQIFIARFCFTLVGAVFGFLWFNAHPAQLFMGDTGSLSLGATLGVIALMTGQWILLPIIAIIPASEVVSVILQIAYFKWTGGKRLIKMAPLHNHFVLAGWSETQIVQRFWLISLLFAMVGVALALS